MTTMSWTLSVLFFQMSWIRRSPFYSAAYEFFFDDGSINRAGCAFGLCMARPAKMRGLSHTCVGVKYFPSRYDTLSWRLLWCAMTRPPFFQSKEWNMDKATLQPLQNLGRSGGSRPYCRKRAYYNSCALVSVLFNVDGFTVIHAPVFRCPPHSMCNLDKGNH